MKIRLNHYLGEYDQEIGRTPLFTSTTTISNLPEEYEIEQIEITLKNKEEGFTTYSVEDV